MNKRTYLLLLTATLTFFSCETLKELGNFAKCKFRYESIRNTSVAGINVQNKKSFTDLGFADAAKLTLALTQKSMPLGMTLNLQVNNPNASVAALNRTDWILEIDGLQVTSGTTYDRVEIPPNNGTATLPINISTDIWQLLSKESRDKILNFAFNLVGAGNKPSSRVRLRIKPTIAIGSFTMPYPGYINVDYDFS